MNANTPNVAPRRRKTPPRRTPAIIEQRERKPVAFGWGADLDRRQREALKERIALFAGIAIAAVIAVLLGWGWYHDNVSVPAARDRQNNQVVAVVGGDTIRYGYYVRVAKFNQKQANDQLTQLQQEQAQLQGDAKKNAAQLAQISAQQSSIEQQLGGLPTGVENSIIENDTVAQRASSLGISVSQKEIDKQMVTLEQRAGGIHALNTYITSGGLTRDEFVGLVKSQLLVTKIQKKLAKSAPHLQTKVRASHILVGPKDKKLAEQLLSRAEHGANFAALARKYSKDTGSAKKGGDLGFALPSTYVPTFAKAVETMPVGSYRLVKSQYGWHIIKLVARKKVKLSPTEYQQAQQSAYQTWLQQQEAKLGVRRVMDVTKIPGLASTSAVNPSGLGNSGLQLPSQGQPAQGQPAPGSSTGSSSTSQGTSGKSSTTTGKSTAKSGTGKSTGKSGSTAKK